jgi:quercetin dioxygenase-like cupin family protein
LEAAVSSVFVVQTKDLPRAKVGGVDDPSVGWQGAFAAYGGHGTTASSTIVYEIQPGKRLGWHTDATEETQYILAGTGELRMEDGSKHQVGPGSVFVIPTPIRHDLVNTGKETLRAVAFFAAAMFTQQFDNVMLPRTCTCLAPPTAPPRLRPAPPRRPPKVAAPLQCSRSNAWTDWQRRLRHDGRPGRGVPVSACGAPAPGRPGLSVWRRRNNNG